MTEADDYAPWRRKKRERPAAGDERAGSEPAPETAGQAGDPNRYIKARIRPLQEPETEWPIIIEGGRPGSRFRVECDDAGLVFRSGPSRRFRLVGLGIPGALAALGSLLLTSTAVSLLRGQATFISLPWTCEAGTVLLGLGVFGIMPVIALLNKSAFMVLDAGPARGRYKGPSGDTEFILDFVEGVAVEGAGASSQSVLLSVQGRGKLFLFYSDGLRDVGAFKRALHAVIPRLRGKRVF